MDKKTIENKIIAVIKTIFDPEIPVDIYEQISQYQKQISNIKNLYNSKFINISVK